MIDAESHDIKILTRFPENPALKILIDICNCVGSYKIFFALHLTTTRYRHSPMRSTFDTFFVLKFISLAFFQRTYSINFINRRPDARMLVE